MVRVRGPGYDNCNDTNVKNEKTLVAIFTCRIVDCEYIHGNYITPGLARSQKNQLRGGTPIVLLLNGSFGNTGQ